MEGEVIPIERGSSSMFWSSRRALVIGCGTFEGLGTTAPTAEDLVDWGMISPLANRLCAGTVVRMRQVTALALVEILKRSVGPAAGAFAAFGYRLSVSPEAFTFVAERTSKGRSDLVRAAVACIASSAERVLIGMIRDRAPAGTHRVLAPDDVALLPPSTGLWRD